MRDLVLTVQVRVPDEESDGYVLGTADNALDSDVALPENWAIVGHVAIVPQKLSDQQWAHAVYHHQDAGHGDIPVRLCRHQECREAYRAYTWGAALDCCQVWRAAR